MTDQELLAAAYKAYRPGENYVRLVNDAGRDYWNPLTDDGDAFRLAVKLRLTPLFCEDCVIVLYDGTLISSHKEPYGIDPAAATRRVITWAAAIRGKSLQ